MMVVIRRRMRVVAIPEELEWDEGDVETNMPLERDEDDAKKNVSDGAVSGTEASV